jgi:hypothetical protein
MTKGGIGMKKSMIALLFGAAGLLVGLMLSGTLPGVSAQG